MVKNENLDIFRKKLQFRSWHRGTREMDLIMGSFADRHLAGFDAAQLETYQALLNMSDPDVYDWIIGRSQPPANIEGWLMEMLRAHRLTV